MDMNTRCFLSNTLSEIFETFCLYGNDNRLNMLTRSCITHFFENLSVIEKRLRVDLYYIEHITDISKKEEKRKKASCVYEQSRRELVVYYLNNHHEVLFYIIMKYMDCELENRSNLNWASWGNRQHISVNWFPSNKEDWKNVNFSLMSNLFA